MKFIAVGRQIFGWSQKDLAGRLRMDVREIDAIEKSGRDDAIGNRAIDYLLEHGVANPSLLRAARALLGLTQNEVAVQADIAPGTYRNFEKDSFAIPEARQKVSSLAKLLSFFVDHAVLLTFTEQAGAGVSKKDLRFDLLPGMQ